MTDPRVLSLLSCFLLKLVMPPLHSIYKTPLQSRQSLSPRPAVMEDVINSVKRLANTTDEADRTKLIDALRNLSCSIEAPDDTIQRLTSIVGLAYPLTEYLAPHSTDAFSTCQTAVVRIGIDLKLLNLLAATEDGPLTVNQLHQETGVAPVLLGTRAYIVKTIYSSALILRSARLLGNLASVEQIKAISWQGHVHLDKYHQNLDRPRKSTSWRLSPLRRPQSPISSHST